MYRSQVASASHNALHLTVWSTASAAGIVSSYLEVEYVAPWRSEGKGACRYRAFRYIGAWATVERGSAAACRARLSAVHVYFYRAGAGLVWIASSNFWAGALPAEHALLCSHGSNACVSKVCGSDGRHVILFSRATAVWNNTPTRFYRTMHFSAKRGIAIACRLSVCPSVHLSVCDVGDCDHIGWNSSKIISPLIIAWDVRSLQTQTSWVYSKGNTPKFGP